jgi:hypothetical protein
MIEFDAVFQRVPIPNDGSEMMGQMWSAGGVVEQPAAPAAVDPESIPVS